MKILITGHKGFIGSEVYQLLAVKGYDVSGFDLGDEFPREKFDFIVHFAARTLIRKSKELPYEYFKDDVDLTLKLLEFARNTDSRFIFPTSGSEGSATNPYSLSKKQASEWVSLYEQLYGVKKYILKLFNIYGEKSRKGAVYLFCKASVFSEEAIIYGDGHHRRDFTHVSDVASVVERIIKGELIPGSYEVGTGVPTSINELKNLVEMVSGKKINVWHADYVLEEAEDLHAKNPVLSSFVRLDEGIHRVLRELK